MGVPQVGGWSTGLATISVKNLTAVETSTIVKLLRPYVPVGTKRTRRYWCHSCIRYITMVSVRSMSHKNPVLLFQNEYLKTI
jgi:hypothetical protein